MKIKNRDPFENHIFCTLLFGSVFFIAFVFKIFQAVVRTYYQTTASQIFDPTHAEANGDDQLFSVQALLTTILSTDFFK